MSCHDTSAHCIIAFPNRNYGDLFRNTTHLDYFKRYLRYHNAHGPLLFIQEVERLRSIEPTPKGTKIQRRKIHTILEKYFRRDDASTDLLHLYK